MSSKLTDIVAYLMAITLLAVAASSPVTELSIEPIFFGVGACVWVALLFDRVRRP